jgi:hypothetical protein
VSFTWHSGAAVADVNGDGRPDLFIAGYTNMEEPIAGSVKGFPSNHRGVRDELFLNLGHRHFEEVGRQAGLDPAPFDHGLGAIFTDLNRDGRPDLYVANDEDPNRLYLNEPGGTLGFHFVEAAQRYGIADRNAGMGIAEADVNADGRQDLFVTNSRHQAHAAYLSSPAGFAPSSSLYAQGLGPSFTGWGDAWVDLTNSGDANLIVASGAIPVTNLAKDAGPIRVLTTGPSDSEVPVATLQDLRTNGRGLAAADYDNDGRVDVAVNTIGGNLLLLNNVSRAGHWLTLDVRPFSPGAIVTLVGLDGRRQVAEVHAGSSYLSSEDPRVHFGLGSATNYRRLSIRYPGGKVKFYEVPVDRVSTVYR